MTTRKIRALCKKLGLGTTYLVFLGHGFYEEKEAESYELENRILNYLQHKQICWYEKELSRLVQKERLHLCTDLFLGEGLLVCDGGTKTNPWEGVTCYRRINPLPELGDLCKQDICKGSKMPNLKQFEKHCRQLARTHWKNKDNYPKEFLRAVG